jgi:hypothetical protein
MAVFVRFVPVRFDDSVDQHEARNDGSRIDLGVSVLRALATSACARMSMWPTRRTPRHKINAVFRTGARKS